jgi:hypothetical protein
MRCGARERAWEKVLDLMIKMVCELFVKQTATTSCEELTNFALITINRISLLEMK